MEIKKKAFVARTAHDKEHLNRLVVPQYGVVEIRFKNAADSKKSKSHLPEASTPPREPKEEGDDKFVFAPGPQLNESTWAVDAGKTDKVKITYHLFNPYMVITEAKLELFRRWEETAMWERELKDDELIDGEHDLEFEVKGPPVTKVKEWDGAVKKTTEFPDGFVTAEHSPYKLRLKVKGEGLCSSPECWTYFHVLVHKLELEWGDVEAVEDDADKRKPFQMLKDACDKPADADDTKGRIYLISHIFKAGNSMFDNSLHDKYKTMWGDGAQIPIYAKVWVRDSGGNAVVAPKALGNTKFLWDWESKLVAPTNTFVTNAQNYDAAVSKPKGQNCHKDRGGKREETDAAKGVFPTQAGYDAKDTLNNGVFPFKVEANDDKRKWAAYSYAWREGKLAAKTGVLFRPSRMAGDKYKITVYSAHEITDKNRKPRLNMADDAPLKIEASLKAESGTLQVWRKMYFRRRMKKSGGATVGVGGIKAYYETSFLDIEDKSAGVQQYPSGEWNTAFGTVYAGWSAFDKYFVDPSVNQHAAGDYGIHFRTRNEFKAYMLATFPGSFASLADVETWMGTNGLATDADYGNKCQSLAIDALCKIFDAKMPAEDGISLFHTMFSMQVAILATMGSLTDGLAHDFSSGSESKCAFLWLAPTTLYSGPQGVDATPAHEIGHHLMLPHPKNTGENTGASANNDYDAHDDAVDNCLMSYKEAARELCGFCQLRVRGWDKSQLSTTSANNKKP